MAGSGDTKKAQEERAKKLQEEIENPQPRRPRNPREFIDEKMRELDKTKGRKRAKRQQPS
jgi:hypothetical protein